MKIGRTIHHDTCHLNELNFANQDELIRYHGYEAEEHSVTTEDGYILTIFRCNSRNTTIKRKRPVIIQHGLLLSSDDFCVNFPDKALGILLK